MDDVGWMHARCGQDPAVQEVWKECSSCLELGPSEDGCWDGPWEALGTKNSSLQTGKWFPAWLTWKSFWCQRPQTPSWRSFTWPCQEPKFLVPTGLVQLLWVLQVAFCTTLNAFMYPFPSFMCDLCFWKCYPFSSPLSSSLYLVGVVLSLYKSVLQSHRVAEINLREIGPTCFYDAVEKVSGQTLHQTDKLKLNFWHSSTIIPLLTVTLKSYIFGSNYSGQLMVGIMAIA